MSQLETNEVVDSPTVETSEENNSSYAESQQPQESAVAEKEVGEVGGVKETKTLEAPTEKAVEGGKDLYKQVLEKLDIKPATAENQNTQENSMQDSSSKQESYLEQEQVKKLERAQHETQIKNVIAQDFAKIQNLMQLGLINSLQGQDLKKQVLRKAFDTIVQNEKTRQNLSPAVQNKPLNKDEVFNEFNKENPNFFSNDGRKEVLDYLKSGNVIVGKDELGKISKMVENVEQTAIDRYLKKTAHEENLNNSNEAAKQKLTANAQNSSFKDKNLSRTFTREQIGKMSSAEFAKYEPAIMEQLKKGLIR